MSVNWLEGVEPPCDGDYDVAIEAQKGAPFVIKGEVRCAVGWFTKGKRVVFTGLQ